MEKEKIPTIMGGGCPEYNKMEKKEERFNRTATNRIIEEYKAKVKAKGSKNAQNNIKSIKSKDLQGKSTAQNE